MVIQYVSDLHLEFPENANYLRHHPITPKAEVLVMAGDVLPFIMIDKYSDFFDYLSDSFRQVYWLPGNHEYYHFDANQRSGSFLERLRLNVNLVNNFCVHEDTVELIFSTLWTKLEPLNWWYVRQNMNDFKVIKFGGDLFNIEHYNYLHGQSMAFLSGTLADQKPCKKVVVSHHVPTYLNYPQQYKNSLLSEAFAVELYNFIKEAGPDHWIFGHHHDNIPDFKISKTTLHTNQLGYVRYKENSSFSTDKIIDL